MNANQPQKAAIYCYLGRLTGNGQRAFGFCLDGDPPESAVSLGDLCSDGTGIVIPPTLEEALMVQLYRACRLALDELGLLNYRMDTGPNTEGQPSWIPVRQALRKKSKFYRK